MAKKFCDLRTKMSPEAQERAHQKAVKLQAECLWWNYAELDTF